MKEATIVKEYKMKCKEHILTPTKFLIRNSRISRVHL